MIEFLSNKKKSCIFTLYDTYTIRKEYLFSLKAIHMLKKYYTDNDTDSNLHKFLHFTL